MASVHQENIAHYHTEMSNQGHHDGHNMYLFHANWHRQNPDPPLPGRPNRNWGTNLSFGTRFLQMHHEMVKAALSEPHEFMQHDSLVAWYQQKELSLPQEWNPLDTIPDELSYEPDFSVFPPLIQQSIQREARRRGITVRQLLTRRTNAPRFTLPKYFSREGVAPNEPGERITGARKLADFRNTNQLGCCIVYEHNRWHGAIGGAMASFSTAIADPIFYFGVHWHVDRVFDEYKALQSERSDRSLNRERLFEMNALESEDIQLPAEFTSEQKEWLTSVIQASKSLRR